MKSCPTHAVESSKIHNGLIWLVSNMSAEIVRHVFDRVQVPQQAGQWKTRVFLVNFVFLDDASKVMLTGTVWRP